jgi:hypothetical protein
MSFSLGNQSWREFLMGPIASILNTQSPFHSDTHHDDYSLENNDEDLNESYFGPPPFSYSFPEEFEYEDTLDDDEPNFEEKPIEGNFSTDEKNFSDELEDSDDTDNSSDSQEESDEVFVFL